MDELKPISEINKTGFIENYIENLKKAYTHDWVFSTIFEKLIVLGSFLWAVYSILMFVWRLL